MPCQNEISKTTNALVGAYVKNFYRKVPGYSTLIAKRDYSVNQWMGASNIGPSKILALKKYSAEEMKNIEKNSLVQKIQDDLSSKMQNMKISKCNTESLASAMQDKKGTYSFPMNKMYNRRRFKTNFLPSMITKPSLLKPGRKSTQTSKSNGSFSSLTKLPKSTTSMESHYPSHQSIRSQSNWNSVSKFTKPSAGRLPPSAVYASASRSKHGDQWTKEEQRRAHTQWKPPSQYRSPSQPTFSDETTFETANSQNKVQNRDAVEQSRNFTQLQSQTQKYSRSLAQAQYELEFDENLRASDTDVRDKDYRRSTHADYESDWSYVTPVKENFKSDLMNINSTVKKLISLGPRRMVNQQPPRSNPNDPLSGWKHPTRQNTFPIMSVNAKGYKEYPKVATAMRTKSSGKNNQAMEKAFQEARHQLKDLKRVSKVISINDRTEISRRLLNNSLMKTKHRENSQTNVRSNKHHADNDYYPEENIDRRNENQELQANKKNPLEQSQTQQPPVNESSCVYLAKSMKCIDRDLDKIHFSFPMYGQQNTASLMSDESFRDFNSDNSISVMKMFAPNKIHKKVNQKNTSSQSEMFEDIKKQPRAPYEKDPDLEFKQKQSRHEKEEKARQYQNKSYENNNDKQQQYQYSEPESAADQNSDSRIYGRTINEPEVGSLQYLIRSSPQSRAFLNVPRKY